MKNNTYAVKVRVSANGYKTKFVEGISIAKAPKEASEQALKMLKSELNQQNPEMVGLLKYEVTKCTKLRTDFIINSEKK